MNSKQIDCAIELSRTLNFRQAAENLYMSQPTLTYQIQTLESELGFSLFHRSGKGATLSVAGEQFCTTLTRMKDEMKAAIETGRNLSKQYKDALNVSIPLRSAIYFLPHIMKQFQKEFPDISLQIKHIYGNERIDSFLRGEEDIIFGLETHLSHIPNMLVHKLFDSHIYLVCEKDDPLAKKEVAQVEDLNNRVLMVGGGSPIQLQRVQQTVMNQTNVKTINSPDHNTTLTNISAGLGVCLCPGFTNDHLGEFAWIPFHTEEKMTCVLGTHKHDSRICTKRFIEIAQDFYKMSAIQL